MSEKAPFNIFAILHFFATLFVFVSWVMAGLGSTTTWAGIFGMATLVLGTPLIWIALPPVSGIYLGDYIDWALPLLLFGIAFNSWLWGLVWGRLKRWRGSRRERQQGKSA